MKLGAKVLIIPAGISVVTLLFCPIGLAQKATEFIYKVDPRAVITISNDCGPITVKPSRDRRVVVSLVTHSDAVRSENEQHGNRIELQTRSATPASGIAEYTVLIPGDSAVTLHSIDGTLRATGLNGDVVLEASTASVEVTDMNGAYVHIKTLKGPVTLSAIRNSHLDVRSASGDVSLRNVTRSSVQVHSGAGQITYDGDPGSTGDYMFTSHSGNLEISIPANVAAEIRARSLKGSLDQTPQTGGVPANGQMSFVRPGAFSVPLFVLHSFKGRIHLKRP